MKLRPYQERLVGAVIADLEKPTEDLSEVVLAACPNAGKTFMSIEAIRRMLDAGAARRVLVLAHATVLLRDNYIEKLVAADPGFTFAEYLPRDNRRHVPFKKLTQRVIVALPQTIASLERLGAFDLVVVDEAHLFYREPMVTKIIERSGTKRVLLLTGTPAPFVARGLPLHAVSMLELYREGKDAPEGPWVADVRIGLLQSRYDVRRAQYNDDGEIKRGVQFRARQTEGTIDDLQKWLGDHAWRATLKRLGKTMMVCRSQAVARQVAAYLRKQGVSLALSTSETDPSSSEVGRFQRDESVQLLVVVCRANLGFDYPNLGALIDMTGTINIDRIFQMFARTVRPRGDNATKTFIKLASADMFVYSRSILKASLLLAGESFYLSWNGKNLNGVRVPVEQAPAESGGGGNAKKRKPRLPTIDDGFLAFEEFLLTKTRKEDGALIAGTTIGEVSRLLGNLVMDPDGRTKALFDYYDKHGTSIPHGHPLYTDQRSRLFKASAMFNEKLFIRAVSLGYNSRMSDRMLGKVFGRLTVLERAPGCNKYRVRCSCGTERITLGSHLTNGHTSSCGCLRIERTRGCRTVDITGQTFGRLTVLRREGTLKGRAAWIFQCSCGTQIVRDASQIKSGRVKSCGCLRKRSASAG